MGIKSLLSKSSNTLSFGGGSSDIVLSIIAYSLCSGTLVLLNKLTLHHIPYPSLVVAFQLLGTCIFIYTCKVTKTLQVDDIEWKYVKPYLYYIIAFSLGVYCNMRSLSISNVETVIVFRSISPCLVAILDVAFLGRSYPSIKSWISLITIVFGAYRYACYDTKFQTQGYTAYIWPTLYLFIISFEMAYGKRIIRSVDLKTLSGPVLYTNMLGLWPFLFFAHMGNEYTRFIDNVVVGAGAGGADSKSSTTTGGGLPIIGIIFLLLGTVVGIGIGYSSWWCRDKVAATTFTLIGVMNKCLTVILNLIIWDQHANAAGIFSLLLCLIGGMFYEQSPLRNSNSNGNTTIYQKSPTSTSTGNNNPAMVIAAIADADKVWDSEITKSIDDISDNEMEPFFITGGTGSTGTSSKRNIA